MMQVLQPGQGPIEADTYVPAAVANLRWGWLPNAASAPVAVIADGDAVVLDTISHEGVLGDQGRDPVGFFDGHGVAEADVLHDARELAASEVPNDDADGPHVVTGPIAVAGARPGDVLRVEVLRLAPRVPYGVISSRHGYGALPGEMPETPGTVSIFCQTADGHGHLPFGEAGRVARFPLAPFLGLMGTAPATDEPVHSVRPGHHGGNIDLNELVEGSTFYLPVLTEGALFYVGDPHFAQGDGEVCLTALEASLRATLRLSVIRGDEARRTCGLLADPFAETDRHWIPMGQDADLTEAARRATRAALDFLAERFAMPRPVAYAYLSAAADFEVTQLVDGVKGVHCLIRKSDFE
jgi:acetamidase/formamidase